MVKILATGFPTWKEQWSTYFVTIFLVLFRRNSCKFWVSTLPRHPISLRPQYLPCQLSLDTSFFFIIHSLFKTSVSQLPLFFLFFSWANLFCFLRTNLPFLPFPLHNFWRTSTPCLCIFWFLLHRPLQWGTCSRVVQRGLRHPYERRALAIVFILLRPSRPLSCSLEEESTLELPQESNWMHRGSSSLLLLAKRHRSVE